MVQHTVVGNTAAGVVRQREAGGVVAGWGRNHGSPDDCKSPHLDHKRRLCNATTYNTYVASTQAVLLRCSLLTVLALANSSRAMM